MKVLLLRDLPLRRAIFKELAEWVGVSVNVDSGLGWQELFTDSVWESKHTVAGLMLLRLAVLFGETEAWIKSCHGVYQIENATNLIKLVVNWFVPLLLGCTPYALYKLGLVQM